MSPKTNIFFTGATGYIGGTVLLRLLDHPDATSFEINALVRSTDKARKLESLGVKTIIGSYGDVDILEKAASEADIILSIADNDDVEANRAILRGIQERHTSTGKVPVLIHTVTVIADDARGAYGSDVVYDDGDITKLDTLAPSQLHRLVDLDIINADSEGHVKAYIVSPPTVWGIVSNKLVDMGVQNPHSVQIPFLIKVALSRGRSGIVGEGKNIWGSVNIVELVDFYMNLFDALRSGANLGHGRDGYYFTESDEYTVYQVSKAIGESLVAIGRTENPEPTSFTQDEINQYFRGSYIFGTNARSRGTRSRALGWKPLLTTKDMLATLQAEVGAVTKKSA